MRRKFLVWTMSGLMLTTAAAPVMAGGPGKPAAEQTEADPKALIGRWDITVDENGKSAPSWLEVKLSGYRTLVGYYVGTSGSARPVAHVKFENGAFSFSVPPQWESGKQDLVVEGRLAGDGIEGTVTNPDGKKYSWKGVKAPYLVRTAAPVWGKPINLFNGKNLDGWKASGEKNQWEVVNGVLTSAKSGSNLISEQTFTDFKLHVEFRYKKGSNSGVYLRGRHEVQIEDSPKGAHPSSVLFSGVYGFIAPSEINALGPDQWQSYDITLVGRMVTIVVNGKTVVSNQEIPGITGGALDSNEGAPGPIYFQGDHGPIEFRKVVITPAK
ncbi:3-keto-disaccharide hydrolase [Chitinophaga lutea]